MTIDCDEIHVVSVRELAEQIRQQLLTRLGEPLTPELADERARNIASTLGSTLVDDGGVRKIRVRP